MVVRISNPVHLEVLSQVAIEHTGVELEVYDKAALGTMLASLSDAAEDVRFTAPLGPDGVLSFRIHREHAKAVHIARGNLIKVRYDGIYVSPPYFISADPTTELAERPSDEMIEVRASDGIAYLDEYVLRNEELAPGQSGQLLDGKWHWTAQPPAAITVRQFEEAQSHLPPFLPDLTYDFNRVVDSQNNPWPETVSFEENVGAGLGGVVRKLMALGFEAQMRHDLLFQAFVEYSRHFETSIVFGAGNIYRRERPAGTSRLLSRMLVVGADGVIIEVVDPGVEALIGHPVIGSLRFDSDDPTTLDRVGKAALAAAAAEKTALTLPVRHGPGLEPFIDYRPGDFIGHQPDGAIAPETRRILAITVSQANGTAEPEIELELDAIVLTPEQRSLAQLRNLSGVGGLSAGAPALGGGGSSGTGPHAHPIYQPLADKGVANGYAPLDSGVLVPLANLPAVDALGTADTDTAKVLSPDGLGGVQFRAEAGGGGSFTHTYVGTNSIGGSTETVTSQRHYVKSITLASDGVLSAIEAYMQGIAPNNHSIMFGVWADEAGSPGHLLHGGGVGDTTGGGAGVYLQETTGANGDFRWFGAPIGRFLAAGTYWIGFRVVTGTVNIAFDSGTGSDRIWTATINDLTESSATLWADTDSTNDYSIRGSVLT